MAININAYARLARFDKPAGAWLLLLPCWWGLALAHYGGFKFYALFGIGAVIMRGAGCVINDMADRKFDAQVERTKNRPLASGEISTQGAALFLILLLMIGLVILVQLPQFAIIIGLISVPLFVTYPFMKRVTYWPQIFLGLTFNIGILISYAAVRHTISSGCIILYIAAIFWTLGYDTIYAHQDKNDDVQIGVKSTAIRLGDKTKYYVGIFYIIFITLGICAVTNEYFLNISKPVLFATAGVQLIWQVRKLDINDRVNCMRLFKSNIYFGLLIFLAILV